MCYENRRFGKLNRVQDTVILQVTNLRMAEKETADPENEGIGNIPDSNDHLTAIDAKLGLAPLRIYLVYLYSIATNIH